MIQTRHVMQPWGGGVTKEGGGVIAEGEEPNGAEPFNSELNCEK